MREEFRRQKQETDFIKEQAKQSQNQNNTQGNSDMFD